MTKSEVAGLVAILMAFYPNARVPDGTIAAYEMFMLDLDHERAQKAVKAVVRSSKFFPTIAEIVAAYEGEKATEEIPYHRRFAPPRRRGLMRPGDLAAEAKAWLAKNHPKPEPKPEPALEPEEPTP
jgi:hypothetical protein